MRLEGGGSPCIAESNFLSACLISGVSLRGAIPPSTHNGQKCTSQCCLWQTSQLVEHIAFLDLWCFNRIILCTQNTERMPLNLHDQCHHPSWVLATWRPIPPTLPFQVVLRVLAPPTAARVACGWVIANEHRTHLRKSNLWLGVLPNEANHRQRLLILWISAWAM